MKILYSMSAAAMVLTLPLITSSIGSVATAQEASTPSVIVVAKKKKRPSTSKFCKATFACRGRGGWVRCMERKLGRFVRSGSGYKCDSNPRARG